MKERKTLDLTITAKACVLSMLVLVFFMLMIPVFQIGQNHEYRLRIASAEESIRQLDQVERTLKSEISMSRREAYENWGREIRRTILILPLWS